MTGIRPNDLSARVARLEAALRAASRPQLGHASIEGGRIQEYDGDSLVQVIGRQWDGTHGAIPVNGPPPPQPGPFDVVEALNGLRVRWPGTWAPGEVAPMNFARIGIHVGGEPDFAPAPDNLMNTIESAAGGEVFMALSPGVKYVRLVAYNLAGKLSDPTDAVEATPKEIGDFVGELGGSTVFYGPTEPEGAVIGDVWYQEVEGGYRLEILTAEGWQALPDPDVAAALSQAQAAFETADSKVRVYTSATPPVGLTAASENDIWIDTAHGNLFHVWVWDEEADPPAGSWIPRQLGNDAIASVSADKITAGSLLAQVAIVGRLFTALTGRRVELSGEWGLRYFDEDSVMLVDIGPMGAMFQGLVRTAPEGSRIELGKGLGRTETEIRFYSDDPAEIAPGRIDVGTVFEPGDPGEGIPDWWSPGELRLMPPSREVTAWDTSGTIPHPRIYLTGPVGELYYDPDFDTTMGLGKYFGTYRGRLDLEGGTETNILSTRWSHPDSVDAEYGRYGGGINLLDRVRYYAYNESNPAQSTDRILTLNRVNMAHYGIQLSAAGVATRDALGVPLTLDASRNLIQIQRYDLDTHTERDRIIIQSPEIRMNGSVNISGPLSAQDSFDVGGAFTAATVESGVMRVRTSPFLQTSADVTGVALQAPDPNVSVVFTAPPSGTVEVGIQANIQSSTAAAWGAIGYEVRTGDVIGGGSVVEAAGGNKLVIHTGTGVDRVYGEFVTSGLTPGAVYHVRQMHRSSGASTTSTTGGRLIKVRPSL